VRASGLLTHRTRPSAGRTVQAGCGTQIWGQARCPICRSGTFNVQSSTLNVQWGDRKGAWWPGMGTDTMSGITIRNSQRPTLNFQRGDRKGAWWAEYGDRHGVWVPAEQIEGQARYLARAIGLLTDRTCPIAGRTVPASRGAQIWGQTRCPICRSGTSNVKRSTLNFERGDRKGAWRAGYGDRHGIWVTELLTRRT